MKNLLRSKRTLIVGILNITPDSFSDGGLFFDKEKAIAHAKEMIRLLDLHENKINMARAEYPVNE